ncbi:hypothetical protein R0137_10035 [Congregibacter brevis]|uniref:Uncharacterized protein n=1 Tax=Congregibacter brevis TaxID=3081201 RepID=A0ABZ0I8E3_9GAMM|nr:hypothetical protein R0137_10035 [Congregibacter sp. IMCC45268]
MTRLYTTRFASKWIPAIALVLFIAMQATLAGHIHTDDGPVSDCSVCQFDHEQPSILDHNASPPVTPTVLVARRTVVSAKLNTVYRLNARGPPTLS